MPYQPEDGTGKTDATGFVSIPFFTDYCELRGYDLPANPEAALVNATDWLQAEFADEWRGLPLMGNQALDWPRQGIIDPTTGREYERPWMPRQLLNATCELALATVASPLRNNADPSKTSQIIEETLPGPITTKYNPMKPNDLVMSRNFPQIRAMLSALLSVDGYRLVVGRA